MLQFQVNGALQTLDVHPYESALDVLRDRLRLTGTKYVCGSGACGACTVLLDGEPVVSCVLPAHALDGHTLTTIEGFGPEPHPVQNAFIACDALQCGFCTPGCIIEGIAFYERWQQQHKGSKPSREEVVAALAGHLCRCGAYPGMITAIQEACCGCYDYTQCAEGRQEAKEKVTGQARYTIDISYEGQLEGRILRSPYLHARVVRIDTSKATALPEVKAIVELLPKDRLVRYIGQEILALAAVDSRAANHALQLIEVEYEEKPGVTSVTAARKPQAPKVYHWNRRQAPNAGESPLLPTIWKGNVRGPFTLMSHQRRKARYLIHTACQEQENHLVEGRWSTQAVSHSAFEPHACVALWPTQDSLTVHLSTQACTRMAHEIARRWHLPAANVHVLSDHVGGAFGSKLELTAEAIAAIELSRKAHAPVRVVYERAEELTVGGYRPAVTLALSLLADATGNMKALSVEAYGDTGIAIGSLAANLCQTIYPGAPKSLADYDIVTHNPPGKPFRGPGGPPACWALEQAVDEMACRLGEDPLSLRRRWKPAPQLQALYDWVETLPAWRDRLSASAQSGPIRGGIGLAVGNWPYFLQPNTQVRVMVTSGALQAATACQDMGNGTRTVIAQALADVFGISPHTIEVRIGDSKEVVGPASSGSRSTTSLVPAVQDAAEQMQAHLVNVARQHFELTDAVAVQGGVAHADGFIPWSEVFAIAPPLSVIGKRRKDARRYQMPFPIKGLQIGSGSTWGVHVSEVEVDMRFGMIRVLRVWGGFAAGRIVVPPLARSQAHGGIIQGIGYALYEERQQDPLTGIVLSTNLTDYRLPGIADMPEIQIYFYEEGFDYVPGGAVGLAELTTLAVAASIGNAVAHATGWRPRALPLRPDRVLAGMREGKQ